MKLSPGRKKSKFKFNLWIIFKAVSVIMIWRGTWIILDYYLLPDNQILGAILSIILGVIILLADDWMLKEMN